MQNYNLYIVISSDRHRDDIFTLFKTEEGAIDFAKREFKSLIKRFDNITKEDRKEFDELIETNKYADYIDGDYSVKVVKTNYPI